MSAIEQLIAHLTPKQAVAVLAVLNPSAAGPVVEAPPPAPTPPRMTDADYLANLSDIAAGRRDRARRRQIVPGSAMPPGPDTVSRTDAAGFVANSRRSQLAR